MHFMAVKKLKKHSGFRIYSYFKDNAFTAVKGIQSSKLGMRKGYHMSMEGILAKEVPCLSKHDVKDRVGGLTSEMEPPRIKLCRVPPLGINSTFFTFVCL